MTYSLFGIFPYLVLYILVCILCLVFVDLQWDRISFIICIVTTSFDVQRAMRSIAIFKMVVAILRKLVHLEIKNHGARFINTSTSYCAINLDLPLKTNWKWWWTAFHLSTQSYSFRSTRFEVPWANVNIDNSDTCIKTNLWIS